MIEQVVHVSVAEFIIIRYLVNKGAKLSDILRRLQSQSTWSKTQVFERCKKFKKGHTSVENLSYASNPKTSTT